MCRKVIPLPTVKMLRAPGTVVRALSSLLCAETTINKSVRLDLGLGVAAVREGMTRVPRLFRNIFFFPAQELLGWGPYPQESSSFVFFLVQNPKVIQGQ